MNSRSRQEEEIRLPWDFRPEGGEWALAEEGGAETEDPPGYVSTAPGDDGDDR